MNAKDNDGDTPLDWTRMPSCLSWTGPGLKPDADSPELKVAKKEIADLLRKHAVNELKKQLSELDPEGE